MRTSFSRAESDRKALGSPNNRRSASLLTSLRKSSDESTKEVLHRDPLTSSVAPDRASVDHSGVEQRPAEVRVPTAWSSEEAHFVPQAIESIQSGVVVGVETTNLSSRPIARALGAHRAVDHLDRRLLSFRERLLSLDDSFQQARLVAAGFPALGSAHLLQV